MWLPPKVRHLVLINQTPLPSPPLLLLLLLLFSPLSFLPIHSPLLPIFGEKPACSWDNPKLKTNSQLPSETKGISWALFEKRERERERKKNTHFWLLIVEECLSKLWSYQAQSVAREGRYVCLRKRRARGILFFCWRRCGE